MSCEDTSHQTFMKVENLFKLILFKQENLFKLNFYMASPYIEFFKNATTIKIKLRLYFSCLEKYQELFVVSEKSCTYNNVTQRM